MDQNMQNYFILLNENDKELLQTCLGDYAGSADKNLQKHLTNLLQKQPYPVLQILINKWPQKSSIIKPVLILAMEDCLNRISDKTYETRFLLFLIHLPQELLDETVIRELMERFKNALKDSSPNNELYLLLLSTEQPKLISNIYNMFKEAKWQYYQKPLPSAEYVLYQALEHKTHFLLPYIRDMNNFHELHDKTLRDSLSIIKLIDIFSDCSQCLKDVPNLMTYLQYLEDSNCNTITVQIKQQLKRWIFLCDFIQTKTVYSSEVTVHDIISSPTILSLLLLCTDAPSYEDVKVLIETIYSHDNGSSNVVLKEKELEILNYYFCLHIVYDVVNCGVVPNEDQYLSDNILMLNTLLRHIGTFNSQCQLLEDIFHVIFMKREYLNKNTPEVGQRAHKSSDTSYRDDESKINNQKTDKQKNVKSKSSKFETGFICRAKPLQYLVNCLKTFVTKKYHSNDYKTSSLELQERFQQIIDFINNILSKYSILEQLQQNTQKSDTCRVQWEKDQLIPLIKWHVQTLEPTSSDEENGDENVNPRQIKYPRFYTMRARRKVDKKRRRATFGGSVSTALQHSRARAHLLANTMFINNSLKQCSSSKLTNCHYHDAAPVERSIIPKLLYSVEQLVNMALSLKHFSDAKKLLENFNPNNTHLNSVLSYLEHQQQIKLKLLTIYNNYQQIEKDIENSQEPLTTVEQIRRVAVKGFEVSKIIGILDNFVQSETVQPTRNLKKLLTKHAQQPQYQILNRFVGNNFNAIIIFDLILNLPFNYDITSNILQMIKRHHNTGPTIAEPKVTPSIDLCDCVTLLENFCECMRLLGNKSLKELLCNNIYSLRPEKLSIELERDRVFEEMFYKNPQELRHYSDLKALSSQFQKLKSKFNHYERFCAYICQFSKLLQLHNPQCNYRVEEMLNIDPYDIIGELIFTHNTTPLEIEAIVSGLNINLVHAVALNICPEITDGRDMKERVLSATKLETALNYVENHNRLLAYLLRGISDGQQLPPAEDINVQYLERVLQMPEIEQLSSLYNGNKVLTALLSSNIKTELWDQVATAAELFDLLQLEMGLQESSSVRFYQKDCLIVQLIDENPNNVLLCSQVHDVALRAKLIQKNFMKIPSVRQAKQLIESTLHHKEAEERISQELRQQLETILTDITVYAKISEVMNFETWPEAYEFSLQAPDRLFGKLLKLHLYKLTYEWCTMVKLAENFELQRKVFLATLSEAFLALSDDNQNEDSNAFHYLQLILETFPLADCLEFVERNKDRFRSVALLRYAVKFLHHNVTNAHEKYRNYEISLIIFEHFSPDIRKQFWNLLKFPLLIVEQLIMNTKFELMNEVLPLVRRELIRRSAVERKKLCELCFDKRGHIYDINPTPKSSGATQRPQFQLGASNEEASASTFILLNFNLYQSDHHITNDCIDLLLRIYAIKALDYHISAASSNSEPSSSHSTCLEQSLDSLCGDFRMPPQAPQRSEWIRDEDVSMCMCCHCTFTMFIRRHHCRRCGRVICFACSPYRMRIPELYQDVEVRVCSDCHRVCADINQRSKSNSDSISFESEDLANANIPVSVHRQGAERFKWKLSGNITHDKLLREEFCYEHAPSVALCLAILEFHMGKEKCVDLLLFHCRKLEKLIIPNPEVDYELVAKMMNCLALAAKVRGAPAEVETVRLHSEIIISVVQNGCESLIPPDLLISKLADALVQSEHWELALEVHLKCGLPTTGVMAAHGLSCLRAGCYETAREKFSHCMPKLTNVTTNTMLNKLIFGAAVRGNNSDGNDLRKNSDLVVIKRPPSSPALLKEILELIKSLPIRKCQPETLLRASVMRNSSTSLASLLTAKRKDSTCVKRTYEPALNILNTLANLKGITQGQYNAVINNNSGDLTQRKQLFKQTHAFDECLYYILTYGSHADIIQFLLSYNDVKAALNYYLLQQLESDLFVQYIYLESLKNGWTPQLITQMREYDARLLTWRSTLLHTCRYLESQKQFHSLYQLQLLLDDPIRAAMTCVKFYSMQCDNFQQQHTNAQHLRSARLHLQTELEMAQWEHVNTDTLKPLLKRCSSRRSSTSSTSTAGGNPFTLKMDARLLNFHINTIVKQLEVAKFLASCEENDDDEQKKNFITKNILKQIRNEVPKVLPTLFEDTQEKIEICVLLLLCGKNFEEGFGLAYRIMQDYKLPTIKVYAATAKYLARNQRLNEVDKLLHCVASNNEIDNHEIDEVLWVAINSAVNSHKSDVKTTLDNLVEKLHSIEMRISAHIFLGQLKSAYLLANKYERIADIRKILRHAEATNQIHIKKLCEKKLQMRASSSAISQLQRT